MAKGMLQRGCSLSGLQENTFPQPNSLTLSHLLSSGWKSIEERGTSLRPGDSGGGHRGDSAAGTGGSRGDTEAGERQWERQWEREAMPEVTGWGMGPSWLLV